MRRVCGWMVVVLLLALGLGGCGKKAGTETDRYKFTSQAKTPSGEPVYVTFALAVGDGTRTTTTMTGTMDMGGKDVPSQVIDMRTVASARCTEVRANGDRAVRFEVEEMALPGGESALEDMGGLAGTIVIGRDGAVKDTELAEGMNPTAATVITSMLQKGSTTFVPVPPEGLRVGEAIDLAAVIPESLWEGMGKALGAGAQFKPKIEGEYVLMGTKMLGGLEVAEFAVNMVMRGGMKMDIGKDGRMAMTFSSRSTGTMYMALTTGLTTGTLVTEMEQTMRMSGPDRNMSGSGTLTQSVTIESLK